MEDVELDLRDGVDQLLDGGDGDEVPGRVEQVASPGEAGLIHNRRGNFLDDTGCSIPLRR